MEMFIVMPNPVLYCKMQQKLCHKPVLFLWGPCRKIMRHAVHQYPFLLNFHFVLSYSSYNACIYASCAAIKYRAQLSSAYLSLSIALYNYLLIGF